MGLFRAVRFVAFPVAFRFFANWFTFWFRGLAMSDAVRLFAYSNALRTVEHFATFIWAFNLAFGFFTFYITDCVFWFGARSVAFGRLANGITNCWAMGIIAFPGALRMTLNFEKLKFN